MKSALAEFLNVDTAELVLTHNVTEGINIVAQGLQLKLGDEVILTNHEHVGNALPWLHRMKRDNIRIKILEVAQTAEENISQIKSLITRRTKVIAIPHITCTLGHVLPIKEIAEIARRQGIRTFIDGAHGPGSTNIDLKALGCDFYASCGHKWMLGPKGTGFLYIRKPLIEEVAPIFVGSGSDTGWSLQVERMALSGYQPNGYKYHYGTQNIALYKGLEAAIEFLSNIGIERIDKRVRHLSGYLQERLINLGDRIEMLTPTEARSRGPIIGFRMPRTDYKEFARIASKHNFRIRIVPESGLNSLRLSTHIYNNKEEIDKFIEFIEFYT